MDTYSHRGCLAQENTLQSFYNSFPKFSGIELDVRLSKDKIPFVIHDSNLKRTHGLDNIIHQSDSSILLNIKIPTLEEILIHVKKNNSKCIIDIKVPNNTDTIINYVLKYKKKHTLQLKNIICITYTDNHKFPKGILFCRGYRLQIPKHIDPRNYGISVQFTGTLNGIQSILHTLDNYNHHVNLYIRDIPNKNSWSFLSHIKLNYSNKISITMDFPIYTTLRKKKYI